MATRRCRLIGGPAHAQLTLTPDVYVANSNDPENYEATLVSYNRLIGGPPSDEPLFIAPGVQLYEYTQIYQPQDLWKFHTAFDHLLASIAPNLRIVLVPWGEVEPRTDGTIRITAKLLAEPRTP